MATTKLWTIQTNIANVSSYVSNPDKTVISQEELLQLHSDSEEISSEKVILVKGINCSPKYSVSQFNIIKRQYDKTDGIQAYHGYISFAEGEVTPQEAIKIASDFARTVWGNDYQILLACHNNTNHLHCHYLINSVSFVDGHRLHDEKAWFEFSKVADDICKQNGKSVVKEPSRNNKKLTVRKKRVKQYIDQALLDSSTYDEFVNKLSKQPCVASVSLTDNNWRVIPEGWTMPVLVNELGKGYDKESILSRFEDTNVELVVYDIPEYVTKKDSLVGIQKNIANRITEIVDTNKVVKNNEPSILYLPRKIINVVSSLCKTLEIFIANKIENFTSYMSHLSWLRNSLISLRKKRNDKVNRYGVKADITPISKEIKSKEEMCLCLESAFDVIADEMANEITRNVIEKDITKSITKNDDKKIIITGSEAIPTISKTKNSIDELNK